MVRAAVLAEPSQPLTVQEIRLPPPGDGQVRVRVEVAGVCHSDLSLADGTLRQEVPAVLGHEAGGVVVEVGPGVDQVGIGDRVLLNWAPPCGSCWFCSQREPWLCEHASDAARVPHGSLADGTPLYPALGTGAFAEETVVSERAVVVLPDDMPFESAALVGCAGLTGYGAVTRTSGVGAGQSVAVIGLGGVGLSVLQAAELVGAEPRIAVDTSAAKEELAEAHGATHFLLASPEVPKQIRALTGGRGVDHAFECVGSAPTIRTAWSASRRGAAVTVVGIGSRDSVVEFHALELNWLARTLRGCVFGSIVPEIDVPRLLEHVRAGEFQMTKLVTGEVGLEGINDAFGAMTRGVGGRTIVRPNLAAS